MRLVKLSICAVIICNQAAVAAAEPATAEQQPTLELLQLLGEWQPDDDRWLQRLDSLERLAVSSETDQERVAESKSESESKSEPPADYSIPEVSP